MKSGVVVLIPARYGSSRFPGKVLADRTGRPMICHVLERVQQARCVGRIVVATDDRRIFDVVSAFAAGLKEEGGVSVEARMTRPEHLNGTSRIAEVAEEMGGEDQDILVNVQADEPEIEPGVIDQLVQGLAEDREAPMATLASPFAEGEDPADPNIVKVVTTVQRPYRALYFSRSVIPFYRRQWLSQQRAEGSGTAAKKGEMGGVEYLKHPGLYAYRRWFLLKYVRLPPTPLEQAEELEQLRVLEHGYPIAVVKTVVRYHGIDTPEQYEAFVRRYREGKG